MKKFFTLTAIFAMLFSASAIAQDFPSDPGTVLVDLETVAFVDGMGDSIPGQAPTGAGSYTLGDSVTVTARTIPGYTFLRWDDQETANPRKIYMDQSKSVAAFYSHDLYTVIFLDAYNDTIAMPTNGYYYGDEVSEPDDPAKEATAQYTYYFTGWDPEITEVTGNQTYRPVFDSVVNSYAITFFDYDSLTVLARDTVAYGEMPTPPADPTHETVDGVIYTFAGWAPTIEAVVGEADYYAQFSTEDIIYNVVFTLNFTDGKASVTDTLTTTYFGDLELDATIPDDYHFISWSDGAQEDYPRTVTIVSDTAFIANVGPSFMDIQVAANQWTFFCLPEILIGDGWQAQMLNTDSLAGVAWGTYSGELRASAQSGWYTPEEFYAKQGYIVYSTKTGVLRLDAYPELVSTEDVSVELMQFEAVHEQNANWNFIGNPYNVAIEAANITLPDTAELTATIWNGTGYDNELLTSSTLAFQPMQAFFVQAKNGGSLLFSQTGNPAPARRAQAQVPENSRIDIQATAGGYTDKTRIIFRSNSSVRYEAGRDASKFITKTAPVQMYFIDVDNVECAQMVRPAGEDNIRLGYMLRNAGEMTIEMPVYANDYELYDTQAGQSYDLNETVIVYSQAGTFNNRFELRPIKKVGTAIEDNSTVTGTAKLFINGQLYIIRDGRTFTVQGIEAK